MHIVIKKSWSDSVISRGRDIYTDKDETHNENNETL